MVWCDAGVECPNTINPGGGYRDKDSYIVHGEPEVPGINTQATPTLPTGYRLIL
jgi:hypothetical protein